MRYVVDSSVAARWVIPEIDSDRALRLLDAHVQGVHELVAPDWFLAEVANMLGKAAAMRGLLTADEARQGFTAIHAQIALLFPAAALVAPALELAIRYRRAVYDCLYVALAEREQRQLVTADQALVNQLARDLPFVTSLSGIVV